jgi:hypothetical protein
VLASGLFRALAAMNRAAAARPSGVDAEPEPWERVAFLLVAMHIDPIELVGAKRALKAFFFRLLPNIKVEDSFGEADQVLSTLMVTAGGAFSDPEDDARFAHQPAGEDGVPPRPDVEADYLKAVDDAMAHFDAANVHIWNALRQDDAKSELIGQLAKSFRSCPKLRPRPCQAKHPRTRSSPPTRQLESTKVSSSTNFMQRRR